MVKMAVGAGTDSNANPGLKRRARPAPGVAPAMLAAPGLSGPALVGAALRVDPGVWGGVPAPAVTPRWRRNGVDVPGATALDYVPVAADDGAELRCVVTASNASGTASAVTEAVRVVHPAPVAAGALADLVLDQGQGARTLDASGAFTGAALVFRRRRCRGVGRSGDRPRLDPARRAARGRDGHGHGDEFRRFGLGLLHGDGHRRAGPDAARLPRRAVARPDPAAWARPCAWRPEPGAAIRRRSCRCGGRGTAPTFPAPPGSNTCPSGR